MKLTFAWQILVLVWVVKKQSVWGASVQCLPAGSWCQWGMTNTLWHLSTDLNRALNRRALFQRPGNWCKEHLHPFESLGPAYGYENLTWLGSQPCLGQEVGLVDPSPPSHLYFPDKQLFCYYFGVLWLFNEPLYLILVLKCCRLVFQQKP